MSKSAKTEQLQLRVSRLEKAAIQRAAAQAGVDMSTYVLSRALPQPAAKYRELVEALMGPAPNFALAELNSLLTELTATQLNDDIVSAPPPDLSPFLSNYLAALVEQACARRGVRVPAWTRRIAPLSEPAFATSLKSLRLYLLTHSPPSFRSRNLFVDSGLGERV